MPAKPAEPIYQAQPRQDVFHSSPAKFRLFGGAAGGGKSEAILFEAIALCNEIPGAHGLILRKTFPELKMSLIMRALQKLPRELYKYSANDHTLLWKPTGSTIQFGYLQKEEDVHRYQSAEFEFIGIDEVTQFEEFVIKYLWSRLRSSKKGVVPKFFAATNPGGPGHAFIKRLFIDNKLTPEEQASGFKASDFVFIPSKVEDNKYINQDYVKNLMMLPENERKMLLEGSWEVFEGRFFEDFIPSIHVIDDYELPEVWKRYRGIDFGRTAPFACLWFAVDYDGNVIVYREYYKKGREVDENSEAVVQLSGKEHYSYSVIDTSVFAKTGFGETIGERMRRKGLTDIIPAHKSRISGWSAVKQYLHFDHTGETKVGPRLKIFKSCHNLIDEMKHALYDGNDNEDLDTNMPDHALDALRYFIMTLRDRETAEPQDDPLRHINPRVREMFERRKAEDNDIRDRYNPYY